MKVLISPLGLTPGAVTSAIYVLQREGYGWMDELITLSTGKSLAKLCEREIERDLARLADEQGHQVKYTPAGHEKITREDIGSAEDAAKFVSKAKEIIGARAEAGDEIYLNLTGGRKSMVVATAMAAQRFDVTLMFHLWVDETIEEEGHITRLLKLPESQRRNYLNPPPDKVALVQMEVQHIGPLFEAADLSDRLQDRLFEEAVGNYMAEKWNCEKVRWRFKPDYLKRPRDLGDVDVYAEKAVPGGYELLALECKFGKAVTAEMVRKLAERRDRIREVNKREGQAITVRGGIVFHGAEWADDVIAAAKNVGVERWQAALSKNWEKRADWQVTDLRQLQP